MAKSYAAILVLFCLIVSCNKQDSLPVQPLPQQKPTINAKIKKELVHNQDSDHFFLNSVDTFFKLHPVDWKDNYFLVIELPYANWINVWEYQVLTDTSEIVFTQTTYRYDHLNKDANIIVTLKFKKADDTYHIFPVTSVFRKRYVLPSNVVKKIQPIISPSTFWMGYEYWAVSNEVVFDGTHYLIIGYKDQQFKVVDRGCCAFEKLFNIIKKNVNPKIL